MEVAFYHDDPSNRISTAYDPQSSPGSVDSVNSTDTGSVSAIAAVPPAYRDHRFGQDFRKAAALKVMNLQVHGSLAYSPQQQSICDSDSTYNGISINSATSRPNSVPSRGFNTSNAYAQGSSQAAVSTCIGSTSNLSLNIPGISIANTSTLSTPDLVNMIKAGSDFDQMLPHYNQSGPNLNSEAYSRNVEHDMYAQNYQRELMRQKTHNGSNPDIVSSSTHPTGSSAMEGSPCSVITSGMNVLQQHHQQFASPDPYFAREQHHDSPSTSGYGAAVGSTIHHIGNPTPLYPSHSLIMSNPASVFTQLKEEPQTVPVISNKSPPMSPIDMEHQEVIKTERKRMRNRLAASKCRKRKLERISRLEEKVNGLKTQNLELSTNASLLRQQVAELKSKVMAHVNSGCELMMSQQQVTF